MGGTDKGVSRETVSDLRVQRQTTLGAAYTLVRELGEDWLDIR
jgi:hypothetical protein